MSVCLQHLESLRARRLRPPVQKHGRNGSGRHYKWNCQWKYVHANATFKKKHLKRETRSSELQQKSSSHVEKNIALINTSTTTLTSSACAAPRKDPAPCGEARHLTVQRSNGTENPWRLGIEGNRGSHPRTVVGACSPPAANYEIHTIHMTQSHNDTKIYLVMSI